MHAVAVLCPIFGGISTFLTFYPWEWRSLRKPPWPARCLMAWLLCVIIYSACIWKISMKKRRLEIAELVLWESSWLCSLLGQVVIIWKWRQTKVQHAPFVFISLAISIQFSGFILPAFFGSSNAVINTTARIVTSIGVCLYHAVFPVTLVHMYVQLKVAKKTKMQYSIGLFTISLICLIVFSIKAGLNRDVGIAWLFLTPAIAECVINFFLALIVYALPSSSEQGTENTTITQSEESFGLPRSSISWHSEK